MTILKSQSAFKNQTVSSHVSSWDLIEGGLLTIYNSRMGVIRAGVFDGVQFEYLRWLKFTDSTTNVAKFYVDKMENRPVLFVLDIEVKKETRNDQSKTSKTPHNSNYWHRESSCNINFHRMI